METNAESDHLAILQALDATNDPCHSCSSSKELTYHRFGLARNGKTHRDWTSTGLSVALSAATFPMLGVGALYGPATRKAREVVYMRLVLCEDCLDDRRGFFGSFKVSTTNGALHPMWETVCNEGFVQLINNAD